MIQALRLILGLFVLIVTAYAMADQSFFGAPVVGTASSASVQVLPQNNLRKYFIAVNNGSTPFTVKFGSIQTAHEGIPVAAGASYAPGPIPLNSVWISTASGVAPASYILMQGQ